MGSLSLSANATNPSVSEWSEGLYAASIRLHVSQTSHRSGCGGKSPAIARADQIDALISEQGNQRGLFIPAKIVQFIIFVAGEDVQVSVHLASRTSIDFLFLLFQNRWQGRPHDFRISAAWHMCRRVQ